jgi:hypothetical protein
MYVQTWVGRSEDGDRAEELLMRGRLEYPVEVSASAQEAAADKYFGKDGPMTEWRRVALSKWRHFKEMVLAYEHAAQHPGTVSPSSVAIDVHMWTLVKTIPFILGLPEEALPELHERQQADRKLRRSALKSSYEQERLGEFGPHQHEEQLPAYPADGLDFADGEDPHAIRAEDLYKPRRWGRD